MTIADGLEGKVALVTGAARGIGMATAMRLARDGADIIAIDLAGSPWDELRDEVRRHGRDFLACEGDVADEATWEETMAQARERFGRIDILFNNAGVMPHQDISFLDADPALWTTIHDINLLGTVLCSKHAVPHLLDAGGGAVVNMSSFLAVLGCSVPQDAYAASKGAVAALTTSMMTPPLSISAIPRLTRSVPSWVSGAASVGMRVSRALRDPQGRSADLKRPVRRRQQDQRRARLEGKITPGRVQEAGADVGALAQPRAAQSSSVAQHVDVAGPEGPGVRGAVAQHVDVLALGDLGGLHHDVGRREVPHPVPVLEDRVAAGRRLVLHADAGDAGEGDAGGRGG